MSESDSTKIGRIDEKVIAMEKWQNTHDKHDDERFDRTFDYIKDCHGKLEEKLDKIDEKVDKLWDKDNQNIGGDKLKKTLYTVGMAILALIAGHVGGTSGK